MLRPQAGIQVDKFYPPTDWLDNNKQIDIRKGAENNSISILYGVKSDLSAYSLFGLYATVSIGTYDVYIDDVLVGSAITSSTQYDIDFSTITTSYGTATTPEELVLHKIVIKPTTSGATINTFNCARTTGVAGMQYNGILWCHFELSNRFNLNQAFASDIDTYRSSIMRAITAQNDLLKPTSIYNSFYRCTALRYIPIIDGIGNAYNIYRFVYRCSNLKRICFRNFNNNSNSTTSFALCYVLEQIQCNNSEIGIAREGFDSLYSLKLIPNKKIYSLQQSVTNATKLQPTKIDASSYTTLTKIGLYGTSTYPMRGLRGLKVSNEAPFRGSSPQIDVNYTGLDRDALVELFQSLPTVTGGQTLNCVACSGNNLTKIGSPTIDENGVASGFTLNSYVETKTSMKYTDSFEMFVEFTFGNDITSVNQVILCEHNNNTRLWKLGSESFIKMRFYDSAISDFRSLNLTYAVQPNTTYKCKAVFKNSKLELFLYDGNNNLLEEKSIDNVKVLINQQIKYGSIGTSSGYFLGTINLPTSYIKEDTNYLVKGYLLDTDKAIATDKGWGLVLS